MRSRLLFFAIAGLTVVLAACREDPRPAPEVFAAEVVAAVACNDFDYFWGLNSQHEYRLGEQGVLVPAEGLAAAVAPYTEPRARGDFERIVRSGRISHAELERLETMVVIAERDRFTLEVFDAGGIGVGVQMTIRKWGEDGYRVLGLHPIPPGKRQDSVVVRTSDY